MTETGPIQVDKDNAAFARGAMLEWYEQAARVFPWRGEHNPYRVLFAEMMLRRTQARQVVAVYQAFIERFPDVQSLDEAPDEEVADVLRPLGLYWRVANFKVLAHEIVSKHGGVVPRSREDLLELTGVGPYVADAVRCFAYGEPVALVDTNTVRVAARYFGFDYNPESRRKPAVQQAVAALIDEHRSAEANYALLDFAAQVCTARRPEHENCPLVEFCAYYRRRGLSAETGG